ncbi:MAG: FecR domain-containing protein [Bacteroidota bacterium]|nr:FecR domain-containing protein [Bacteroidota bacterium]
MHSHYLFFGEEDFIADEYFQQWVRFPDAETNAFWESWLADHPDKRDTVSAARTFLEHLSIPAFQPSRQQVEASLAQSLEKIAAQEAVQAVKPTAKKKRLQAARVLVVAAVVAVCLLGTFLAVWQKEPVTIEVVAGKGEVKTVSLPDGSLVTLNAGSHLTYTSTLQHVNQREVWLDGEAFFDVKHIKQKRQAKRFVVHTKDMDIEVLGTTFNVKKLGGVTNVSLNTGKIKIALKDDPETAIYLQPGDFVRYSSGEKRMLKKKVQADLYAGWKEEKLVLDGMALADIARLLEDAYGYHIVLEEKVLADSKISGTLYVNDEATLLQTLAFTLNINIIKKDSVLFFQSKN